MNAKATATTRRVAGPVAVIVAIVLIALVLRGPIIAVAPIAPTIQNALGLSSSQVGLLTALPVLCFAIATPAASLLIARAGPDLATMICLVGVVVGSVIRSAGDEFTLFAGTIVIGAFITVGNVVVPVIIRRDLPPERAGIATGIYTSSLNVGAMITSIGTAPLALALGWPGALLFWALFAVAAAVVWAFVGTPFAALVRTRAGAGERMPHPAAPPRRRSPVRSLTAILLALAFAGQAFSYYGTTAWLPTLLRDELGYDLGYAGIASSVFQISAIVGALGVPVLARRLGPLRNIVVVFIAWATVPLGLLVAPQLHLAWEIIGGAAQGGGFTSVFIIIVGLATDGNDARRLSAFVQGIGYAVAAVAPTLVGFVRDATGAWTVPLLVIAVGVATFGGCGIAAAIRSVSRPGEHGARPAR